MTAPAKDVCYTRPRSSLWLLSKHQGEAASWCQASCYPSMWQDDYTVPSHNSGAVEFYSEWLFCSQHRGCRSAQMSMTQGIPHEPNSNLSGATHCLDGGIVRTLPITIWQAAYVVWLAKEEYPCPELLIVCAAVQVFRSVMVKSDELRETSSKLFFLNILL